MKLARYGIWLVVMSTPSFPGIGAGWPLPVASESHSLASRADLSRTERSRAPFNDRGSPQQEGKSGKHGVRPVKTLHLTEGKRPNLRKGGRKRSVVEQQKPRASAKAFPKPDQHQKPIAYDLSYSLERDHPGMLQRPERVIPRLDRNHDGQVDSWEREIAQERFHQLDRNRDGIVDPMERALDLVDMDHYGRSALPLEEPRPVRSQPVDIPDALAKKPVGGKAAPSRAGPKGFVQRVERPARAGHTPSAPPRRQARVVPQRESSSR